MKWIFAFVFLFLGCSDNNLTDYQIKKMIKGYFTPFSSVTIAKIVDINVHEKEQKGNHVIAKVCYTMKFKRSYKELLEKIKKEPNSFFARFDVGTLALYGRKFGNFHAGEVKTRCDRVVFERRYGKWHIAKI